MIPPSISTATFPPPIGHNRSATHDMLDHHLGNQHQQHGAGLLKALFNTCPEVSEAPCALYKDPDSLFVTAGLKTSKALMHFNWDLVIIKHVATNSEVIHVPHTVTSGPGFSSCIHLEVVITPRSDASCTSGAEGIKKGFSSHFTRNKNTSVSKSDRNGVIVLVM